MVGPGRVGWVLVGREVGWVWVKVGVVDVGLAVVTDGVWVGVKVVGGGGGGGSALSPTPALGGKSFTGAPSRAPFMKAVQMLTGTKPLLRSLPSL